jgi:hypothetical protein
MEIEIATLIDITNTKVIRSNQGTQLELDQNRNFVTLLQCAEIRSIIIYSEIPTFSKIDIRELGFGTKYTGSHTVWKFRFKPDREAVYFDSKNNEIGLLIADLDGVPVIKNLSETINIEKAIFDCTSIAGKNTIITAHIGTIN